MKRFICCPLRLFSKLEMVLRGSRARTGSSDGVVSYKVRQKLLTIAQLVMVKTAEFLAVQGSSI